MEPFFILAKLFAKYVDEKHSLFEVFHFHSPTLPLLSSSGKKLYISCPTLLCKFYGWENHFSLVKAKSGWSRGLDSAQVMQQIDVYLCPSALPLPMKVNSFQGIVPYSPNPTTELSSLAEHLRNAALKRGIVTQLDSVLITCLIISALWPFRNMRVSFTFNFPPRCALSVLTTAYLLSL